MQKPLFLQVGYTPEFAGMIKDHEPRHRVYCEKWGYHYLAITEGTKDFPAPPPRVPGWWKIKLIQHFMDSGEYSHIFWVDADCFVADFTRDMRETLCDWAYLGMTAHPYPWRTYEPIHLQTGMIYLRCGSMAKHFLQEITQHDYPDEQVAMNALLVSDAKQSALWQQGFRLLSFRWNNTLHDQVNFPIVAAFHGYLDPDMRRMHMREVTKCYPF